MMHDKLEDEGRHAPLEHARVDTHKVLRLSQNSNGVQEKENPSEFNEKNCCHFVNVDNADVNNVGKEKLTVSKISLAETSESSTRNHFGNGVIRIEDENGTKYSKNKLWTNKVDGLAPKRPRGNFENDENDFCPAPESNVKAFFSNLLKFSLKRLYGSEEVEGDDRSDEDGTSDELTEGTMGNLQSGEGKKSKDGGKSPSKKKGGFLSKKSPGRDAVKASTAKGPAPQPPLTKKSAEESCSRVNSDSERVQEILNVSTEEERKVVPPEGIVGAEDSTVTGPNGNVAPDQASPTSAKSVKVDPERQAAANMISDAKYISTDSWRQVQTFEINKERLSLNFPALSPQSRESSSESVFTDPLTPRALEEMKGDKTIGSGSSTISKTSTASQRQETNFEDSTSLDDVTLIDEQLTDTEGDVSMSAPADKCRSASLDVSEGSFSIASAPCQRPFTLQTYKKVDLESLPSASSVISPQDHLRRYSSVSEVPGESNVLRKVASLTLDKNTIEQRVHKPRFVPEKLDFQLYEKFEGQQLINWYVSSFPEDHYLRMILAPQDLKILVTQFCTHMLAAGVLRQIPDKDAPVSSLFRPNLMYFWAHSEAPAVTPATPGRLPSTMWSSHHFSPSSDVATTPQARPGARYTEADMESPKERENPMTASTGSVDKAIRKIETEEFQQVVIGLKREHKENITRLTRGQEVKLFKLRGEHAQLLHEYEERILELEETVKRLSQELERQKTIADIQSLTNKTLSDFESPTRESNRPRSEKDGSTCSPQKKSPAINQCITNLLETSSRNGSPKKASPDTPDSAKSKVSSQLNENNDKSETVVRKSLAADANGANALISKVDKDVRTLDNDVDSTKTKVNGEVKKDVADYKVTNGDASLKSSLPSANEPSDASLSSKPTSPAGTVTQQTATTSPDAPKIPVCAPPPPPPPPPPMASGPPMPPGPVPPPPPPMPVFGGGGGGGPPSTPLPGSCPPPPPLPGMGPPAPPMPPSSGPPPPPPLGGLGPGPPPPPPPFGSAPMPFPTPPVGGWNAQRAEVSGGFGLPLPELRKQPVNPAVPMKPLYWSRIIVPVTAQKEELPSPAGTPTAPLWEKLEEAKIEDYSEFNELFSRQIVTRKPTKKKTQEPSKQQAAKILDSKRSQNVGILSSSLHVDFSEIENAIYHFDTSVVNLEALQQIYEMRATEEELAQIREHVKAHPETPLDKPEQFLLELAEIPNFAERIACFMFQSEYEDNINSIDSKLNNMKSTCEMLLNAESVKTVMAIILALGNYMNGGNLTRGQADGFGIEILPKLRDVKSKDSSITLLHFIVRTYMRKLEDPLNPDLALPVPEPGDINRAAAVNFDEIKTDLEQLEKELKVCQRKTEKVISASSEENMQPFKDKMEAFLLGAQKQIQGEFENLEECKVKFKATVRYYQFKLKTEDEVKEFFGIWGPFSKDFKDIWKKEQQRLIKEKMQEFKKKQDVRKQEIKPVKAGGLKDKMKQRMSLGKHS